jgi:hypothetical protein
MKFSEILTLIVRPLRSRKVRVGLAGLIYTYLGQRLGLSEEQIYAGIGVAVVIIMGIAVEDHGRNMMMPPGEPKAPGSEVRSEK